MWPQATKYNLAGCGLETCGFCALPGGNTGMGYTLWFPVWQEECVAAKTICMCTWTDLCRNIAVDLYSGHVCIWILAAFWQSWLMLPCFSSVPPRKCRECTLIRSQLLPSTFFQFISHVSICLPMLYSRSYWECHSVIYKRTRIFVVGILCFVDRPSLYNLVNKTNLVHNFS
jgi:hypothetical protein